MSYAESLAGLRPALQPLAAAAARTKAVADPADEKQAGRLRHAAHLDTAVEAVADFAAAAESETAHLLRYQATNDAQRLIAEEFRRAYLEERNRAEGLSYEAKGLYRLLLNYLTPQQIAAAIPARPQ